MFRMGDMLPRLQAYVNPWLTVAPSRPRSQSERPPPAGHSASSPLPESDTSGFAGTELIRPADPTIFLTAAAAGSTDRTDDIITANTPLRADYRNDDDPAALQQVRDRLQFLADTGYDLRHNLPS